VVPFASPFDHCLYPLPGKWNGLGDQVPYAIVLLYLLVMFLLNILFMVAFMCRRTTHIVYIELEYIALCSLTWIAFCIDQAWRYFVSIAF
jgi:hypothetical protein